MERAIVTLPQKLALVNAMVGTNDLLKNLVLLLYSNVVNPTQNSVLADLTECIFPGYNRVPAMTGSAAYVGTDRLVHSTFPDEVFVASVGVPQIETATFAGTITTAGNMSVVLTSAGLAGSPITLAVPVALADTGPQLAAKAATALQQNAVIAARFRVSVSGSDVILTRAVPAANDATLNIASLDGTSVGVIAAPTSTNTQAGSATGGTVADNVTGWALLNGAQDTLLYVANLDTPVPLTAAGQGGIAEPDYVYGA